MSESAGRLPLPLPRSGAARFSNDDSLARRAADGDQRAFAAIYKRHHQELYRYCRAILRDSDDAQDALQATMVKALRALPGETREIALKPWLFRIAHNESISIARARRAPEVLDPEAADPGAGVEREAATRERLRELVGDLDQLPERQRGSLVMRELSGLSFEEIGRVFSFSPAAAKQAVYEARVALQEIAEGREMECDLVREAISAQDGRVLRGRRIRAHLRDCDRCSDFKGAIGRRRSDFALLAPPLAAPAALATLQAVLGGSAGAGSAAAGAGAIGAGLGGGAALKAAAGVLAAAAIAGGTAEITGVIDVGGPSRSDSGPAAQPSAPTNQSQSPAAAPAERSDPASGPSSSPEDGSTGHGSGAGGHRGHGHGNSGGSHANSAGHGQATAPGQTGSAPGQATAPGQAGTSPGQSGTAGNSANAPGQTGTAPGQSNGDSSSGGSQGANPNASATGQENSSAAGSNASANGQENGGGTSTAPGRTDTSPGQNGTAGNSADAPGHQK